MSDHLDEPEDRDYEPGSMATSSFGAIKAIWYRRPWVLITATVAIVVAVSVISDLPHHITPAQDAGDQNSAIREINSDLKTCVFSVKEAFNFYRMDVAHKMSAANFSLALKTLLPEDSQSCSFVSSAMTDLTGIEIVDTAAGKEIEKMRLALVHWIDHDARDAINDITYLFTHPGDAKTLKNLALQETYLSQDQQAALTHLGLAGNLLGTTLVSLQLPTLARLPGT